MCWIHFFKFRTNSDNKTLRTELSFICSHCSMCWLSHEGINIDAICGDTQQPFRSITKIALQVHSIVFTNHWRLSSTMLEKFIFAGTIASSIASRIEQKLKQSFTVLHSYLVRNSFYPLQTETTIIRSFGSFLLGSAFSSFATCKSSNIICGTYAIILLTQMIHRENIIRLVKLKWNYQIHQNSNISLFSRQSNTDFTKCPFVEKQWCIEKYLLTFASEENDSMSQIAYTLHMHQESYVYII